METTVRILIAEDDESLSGLWRKAFLSAGYGVEQVKNGEEAIEWLVVNSLPDVLIVDYHMPKANGVDVLKTLRALSGSEKVTTVMATADHTVSHKASEFVDLFLQKPVGFRDMKVLVERLMQMRRA